MTSPITPFSIKRKINNYKISIGYVINIVLNLPMTRHSWLFQSHFINYRCLQDMGDT